MLRTGREEGCPQADVGWAGRVARMLVRRTRSRAVSRVRNTRDLTDLMEEHCDYIVRNWGLYVVRGAGCAARGRSLDCACVHWGDITRGEVISCRDGR